MTNRRIVFIVYEGFELIDLAGPMSVFSSVNDLTCEQRYELVVASEHSLVRSHNGLTVTATVLLQKLQISSADTVLVMGAPEPYLVDAMKDGSVRNTLQHAATHAERYGSVCAGTFLLASAGLLEDKRCTTHWVAIDRLSRFAKGANLSSDALYVQDGRLWTSAGATAGIDMALSMVEQDFGQEVMGRVAKWLVLYARRPGHQSQFSNLLKAQSSRDGSLTPLFGWLAQRFEHPTSVGDMAGYLGMSDRSFYRKFKATIGMSPSKFYEELRMERAKELLETGQSVKQVVPAVGFRSHAAFRKAFKSLYGTTPSHHAKMFASN